MDSAVWPFKTHNVLYRTKFGVRVKFGGNIKYQLGEMKFGENIKILIIVVEL